jgi:chromosome segregation ATPase
MSRAASSLSQTPTTVTPSKSSQADPDQKERIAKLKHKHDEMEARLHKSEAHTKATQRNYRLLISTLHDLDAKHEHLSQLNVGLSRELRELHARVKSLVPVESELARVQMQYEELSNELVTTVDDRDTQSRLLQAVQSQLRREMHERKELEAELFESKSKQRSVVHDLKKSTSQLNALTREQKSRQTDMQGMVGELREALQLKERRLFELTLALRKQENQLTVMAQSKEVMEGDAVRLQKAMSEVSQSLRVVSRQGESRESREAVERRTQEVSGLRLENTSLQQRLKRQKEDLAALQASLAAAEKIVLAMREEMKEERRAHEEEISSLGTEVSHFHAQFQSLLAAEEAEGETVRSQAAARVLTQKMLAASDREAKLKGDVQEALEAQAALRSEVKASAETLEMVTGELNELRTLYDSQTHVVRNLAESNCGAKDAMALQKEMMDRLLDEQKEMHAKHKEAWEGELSLTRAKLAESQKQNKEYLGVLNVKPTLTQAELSVFIKKEQELRVVIGKFVASEKAAASSYTCTECLEVFRQPVTIVPCGHHFCKVCVIDEDKGCPRCGPSDSFAVVENSLLAQLCEKHIFREQALQSMEVISERSIQDEDQHMASPSWMLRDSLNMPAPKW